MIRIFGCPAYYHTKEDNWISTKKGCVFWFQKRCERLQAVDPKDKNIVVSRYVIFDEASMMKPTSSQQVESRQTKEVPQRVESDTTPHTIDSSISFEFSPEITHVEIM